MCEKNNNGNGDPVFSQEFLQEIYDEKTPRDFPEDNGADEFYGTIEKFLKRLAKGKNNIKF